jgi:hypothetical protein
LRKALQLALLLMCASAPLYADDAALLPAQFAGWSKQTPSQAGSDPRVADATQPALLLEYGFTDFESATYARDQRRLEVRAARFRDTSGAYGAFYFYLDPGMSSEDIGNRAGAAGRHVLFYRGNVLVNVMLDKVTVMSAAELRQLSAALPQASGTNASSPPTLPNYLPREALVANSARYVVGPAGLAAVEAPLPASLVDFGLGPEMVTGKYRTASGLATMMLISYPTPQIAAQRFDAIRLKAAQATAAHGPFTMTTEVPPGIRVKRSGPLVALVTAPASEAEALALLAAVNYDAEVTWNERTPGPRDNIGSLLLAIFTLIAVLLSFALVAGIAFGGLRILLKRLFPNRFFDRPESVEFIQLNLRERGQDIPDESAEVSSNSLTIGALARNNDGV